MAYTEPTVTIEDQTDPDRTRYRARVRVLERSRNDVEPLTVYTGWVNAPETAKADAVALLDAGKQPEELPTGSALFGGMPEEHLDELRSQAEAL